MRSFTTKGIGALRARLESLRNPLPRAALRAGADYLRRRPSELLTVAKNAAGLRLTVPLDALRWLSEHLPKSAKSPKDLTIGAAPPALALGVTAELMGFPLRAAADIKIEEIKAGPTDLSLTLRVRNLSLKALGAQDSPMANLFRAMDLSKPGNLINMMPQRPPALVEVKDDRLVVDLLKVPKIAAHPFVRRALEIVTPVMSIADVRIEDDHLVVALRARPGGLSEALAALRR
jgi:hypothetical protein